MSKESLEHLSDLMDGEMSRDSAMFLTRRLASDDVMCETWERYHLIRDCIRQPGGKLYVSGLSEKMSIRLQAEQALSLNIWQRKQWLRPVSGLAIAASVALLAIVVAAPRSVSLPGSAGDNALAQPANKPFVSPNTLSITTASQAVGYSPGTQAQSQRLNTYLLRHNQLARTAGRQGFVSFIPIVANASVADVEADPQPQVQKDQPEKNMAADPVQD